MTNGDLKFDIEKIKDNQLSIETDNQKMAVSKEEDFNLEYPYAIDVEDESYFYPTKEERDNDYDELCEILTKNTRLYLYY